jgi:hypothetical protein
MFYFTQHPVAELFKSKFDQCIEFMDDNENFYYQWCDYKEQQKYYMTFEERIAHDKELRELYRGSGYSMLDSDSDCD